jgi:hypothetical protein
MQHQSERETSVEATVFDPSPPPGIFALFGPALLVAGILLTPIIPRWDPTWALAGLSLIFAYDMRPRRRPKKTRITCKAGAIRVPGRRLIRARDLEGATTTRIGDRVSIVLAHRRRRGTPIVIDVADEAALATLCKSLGIGHNGFGHVDFVVRPTGVERARYAIDALTLAPLVAILASPGPGLLGGMLPLLLLVAAIAALVRWSTPAALVRITSGGIFVPRHGKTFIPFHMIEEVMQRPGELVFRVRATDETVVTTVPMSTSAWARNACSPAELEHLVEQIRAAVERAHGKFVFKPEPTLAKLLERGENEPLGDWLARIDTFGAGAGYRGTVFDAAELWTLLEDPEAKPDVRSAAARILARLDRKTLRVRVGDILATVRDDEIRARIAESLEEEEEPLSARPLLK